MLRLEAGVLVNCGPRAARLTAGQAWPKLAAWAKTAAPRCSKDSSSVATKPDRVPIGSGKAAELRESDRGDRRQSTVICDEPSPAVDRLGKAAQVGVVNRTALILDIFAQHAHQQGGQSPVSLAQMEYMLPRLRDWGESMYGRRAVAPGGQWWRGGLPGPGETKIPERPTPHPRADEKLRRDIRADRSTRHPAQPSPRHSDIPSSRCRPPTGQSPACACADRGRVLVQDALHTLEHHQARGVR